MQLEILEKLQETLIKKAQKARLEESFAPFSDSNVGAAILTIEGEIYTGANVEFTRSSNLHAEFITATKVLQEYILPKYRNLPEILKEKMKSGFDELIAIAEVNDRGTPGCGPCRQLIMELNPDMIFYGLYPNGEIRIKAAIKDLYPLEYHSNNKFKL